MRLMGCDFWLRRVGSFGYYVMSETRQIVMDLFVEIT